MSENLSPDESVVEETKKKGRGPSTATKAQSAKAKTVSPEAIQEVFEFWKTTFTKKRAILDAKRSKAIGAAIHDYGVQACKDAIIGCSLSDFHMGMNAQKVVYNEIEMILREPAKIERFLAIFDDFKLTEEKGDW
jgi:hypothetical protein